jgi:hypothetical protein
MQHWSLMSGAEQDYHTERIERERNQHCFYVEQQRENGTWAQLVLHCTVADQKTGEFRTQAAAQSALVRYAFSFQHVGPIPVLRIRDVRTNRMVM